MNKIIDGKYYDFDSLKHIFDNYEIRKDKNNNLVAMNIKTGEYTYREKIIDKVKFSNLWFVSTMQGRSRKTCSLNFNKDDYSYAFNEGARSTYNHMMYSIKNQIENYGKIDSIKLFEIVNKTNYKHTRSIIDYLVNNEYNYEILNKWTQIIFSDNINNEKNKIKYKK